MQSQPREEPTGADNSDIETTTSHFMKDSRSEDVGINTPSNVVSISELSAPVGSSLGCDCIFFLSSINGDGCGDNELGFTRYLYK
jgi:hypothetical protein